MRTSLSTLAAAGFLLLVLTTAMESEAIRLDGETRAAVTQQTVAVNKSSDDLVKDAAADGDSLLDDETKRSVVVSAEDVRATAHRLPQFHEDYYGASVHEPRHH